jgi:Na+/H+ antiporter NhaC
MIKNIYSEHPTPLGFTIGESVTVIVGAYYLVTVPSFGFACAMEIAFFFGLKTTSWITVLLSSLIGLSCGVWLGKLCEPPIQAAVIGIIRGHPAFCEISAIGLITGVIMGSVIRARPEKMPNHHRI